MKTAGEGSVTGLRNGRFWVRSPVLPDGSRPGLGTYATREEADAVLLGARALQAGSIASKGMTFARFAPGVLDLRDEDGFRGVEKERDRYDCHLANCLISDMLLTEIQPATVAELARSLKRKFAKDKRGKRKLSTKTIRRIMSVGSSIFEEAVQRGLVPFNPFLVVKVKTRPEEDEGEEIATYLTIEEQRRFVACEAIPYNARLWFRILLGTGIRRGEASFNYLRDLHLEATPPYLDVQWAKRVGGVDYRPKNKKSRKVYLFGDALVAFREWAEIRKSFIQKAGRHEVRLDEGLIFPTVTGCRRGEKFFGNGWTDPTHPRATPNGWVDRLDHYYHLAGIPWRQGLHVHALRHTCATSLLEGLWDPDGVGLSLKAVCDHLGHSSMAVTMKYVHEVDNSRKAVAKHAQEAGYALVTTPSGGCSANAAITNEFTDVGPAGLEPATYGLKGRGDYEGLREVGPEGPPRNTALVTTLAKAIGELVRQGQHDAAATLAHTLASIG